MAFLVLLLAVVCILFIVMAIKENSEREMIRKKLEKEKEEFAVNYPNIRRAKEEEKEIATTTKKAKSKLFKEAEGMIEKEDSIVNEPHDIELYASIVTEETLEKQAFEEYKKNKDANFKSKLLEIIDKKEVKDSDVYNKAGISRQVFNNIINVKGYIPTKRTIVRLCLALELTLDSAIEVLSIAGYAFTNDLEDI